METTTKRKYETPTAVTVEIKVTTSLLLGSKDQYDPVLW